MDPLSIVSLLGTAVSLGDVVLRCITGLNSLKSKYHDAPLLITTMIGQLYMVQTALDRLSEWTQPGFGNDPRYQELAEQVNHSLDSFGPLIRSLQQQICQFEPDSMDNKSKIAFLWIENEMGNYSMLLDRQVNALHLLLQAIRCPTWSEQKDMICREESQIILSSARDGSSSMIGLDDSASVITETTARLSAIFDFDAMILSSCIYQAAGRSHLRQAIAAQRHMSARRSKADGLKLELPSFRPTIVQHDSMDIVSLQESDDDDDAALLPWVEPRAFVSDDTGDHVDIQQETECQVSLENFCESQEAGPRTPFYHRFLPYVRSFSYGRQRLHARFSRSSMRLDTNLDSQRESLAAGLTGSKEDTWLDTLLVKDGESSAQDQQLPHIEFIWRTIVQAVTEICWAMDRFGIIFEDPVNQCFHVGMYQNRSSSITDLILGLWKDGGFQRAYSRRHEYRLHENASYFISNVERFARNDYIPTTEDILRAGISSTRSSRTSFTSKSVP